MYFIVFIYFCFLWGLGFVFREFDFRKKDKILDLCFFFIGGFENVEEVEVRYIL